MILETIDECESCAYACIRVFTLYLVSLQTFGVK